MSTDLPIIIDVDDTEKNIDRIKVELTMITKEGMITEEKVSIDFVGDKKTGYYW